MQAEDYYRQAARNTRTLMADRGLSRNRDLMRAAGWSDEGRVHRLLAWEADPAPSGRQATKKFELPDAIDIARALGVPDPLMLYRPASELHAYLAERG